MSTTTESDTVWSKEFPTVPGFYLVRTEQYRELPAEFDGRVVAALHGARFYRENIARHDPEFLGPFSLPDFERLVRLREAVGNAPNPLEYLLRHNLIPDEFAEPTRQVIERLKDAIRKDSK